MNAGGILTAAVAPAVAPVIALVGNPNCGKTALFNALTGSRQKVANYPGVTVEKKIGRLTTPAGRVLQIVDLPGTYSLRARSPDEEITRDVVLGRLQSDVNPDLIVCVADATNLRLHLRFVLELKRLGRPMVLALNMMDAAERRGIRIDTALLQQRLGMPVVRDDDRGLWAVGLSAAARSPGPVTSNAPTGGRSMLFHVRIDVHVPLDTDPEKLKDLSAREHERAQRLKRRVDLVAGML